MNLNSSIEGRRRYRILDLIGRGGGGSVYRVRMEGPDGFTKEVALKVVREDITPGEIARFRDEGRILGLVRDRAIVSVEPPIRLGERWAIVMEYVDGVSAHRLVGRGPIPPRPAVEIVGEIARVLHKVYVQAGPDGEPLQLLHRDLKPANLQITPEGDVKLLDFGVATARFDAREAVTMHTIAGTRGYIAPERLRGIEGPEGDVYSLGVLLHVLTTGDRAVELERHPAVPRSEELERVIRLAERMRDPTASNRPSALEVERLCGALATSLSGPTLRQWAQESVPRNAPFAPDELVGSTLTETVDVSSRIRTTVQVTEPRAIAPIRSLWIPLVALGALISVTLALTLLLLVAFGMGATLQQPQAPVAAAQPVPVPVPVVAVPVPAPPPVEAVVEPPAPVAAPTPVVAPARPSPTPRPKVVADAPAPAPTSPAPVTAAVTPAPAPTQSPEPVGMSVVTFDSDPPGAMVLLDGVAIGRTPLRGQPVSHGAYELRLEQDGRSIVRNIRVSARGTTSYRWEGDQLVAR